MGTAHTDSLAGLSRSTARRYGPGNQVPVSLSEARGVGVAYTAFGDAKGKGNTGNRVCSRRGACCVSVLRRASLKHNLRSLRSCQGLPELAGSTVEKGGGGRAKGPAVETNVTIWNLYNTSTDGRRGELGGRPCPTLDGSRHRIYYYRVVAPAHVVPSPGVISNVA